MEKLIETIVKPLVDFPENVNVKAIEEDHRITYKLTVDKNDVGKVIGKQGRIAKAIRTICYAYAHTKTKKKVFLEISE